MSATILAIDVGKFNSVLCWYEPATRAATSVRFNQRLMNCATH
jgi:hypothetical protein